MAKYIHYVTINRVKYPFHESDSPCLNYKDMEHPKDKSSYLLDIGETNKQRKLLEKDFPPYKGDPAFLIVPKTDISTIGSQPTESFKQ